MKIFSISILTLLLITCVYGRTFASDHKIASPGESVNVINKGLRKSNTAPPIFESVYAAKAFFVINVGPDIIANTCILLFNPIFSSVRGEKVSNIWPKVTQTIGAEVAGYLWDGDQIVRELDASTQTVATLIHGLGLGADVGSLVKAERSGQNQFFHYDWRGSVVALTDAAEQAIKSYTYDAFGDVTTSSGSAVNPYQFSGKQFDPNSGLSYFGRRHYSAQLGRFITQDPKEYVDGLNTYAYVKNNPVNWIDLWGMSTECIDATGMGIYGRYLDGIMTGECELKPVDEEYWAHDGIL